MKGFFLRPLRRNKAGRPVIDKRRIVGAVCAESETQAKQKVIKTLPAREIIGLGILEYNDNGETRNLAVDPEPIQIFIS